MIEMRDVSKTYRIRKREPGLGSALRRLVSGGWDEVPALRGLSFTIPDGQIVGYIGPNGAGKSTTIKILSGILRPDSGSCTVDGLVPWADRKAHVARLGVVFGQRSQLWWDVPILDSFQLLRDIYRVPPGAFAETLERLTELLDLGDLLRTPARMLSLGQRMRCEIAASLLHSPRILFLDEPTIGLDAITKLSVRDFIKFINKKWKTTIILTTHDMSDIDALTNKIILIGKGQILYNGTFDNIKEKYSNQKIIQVELSKEYDNFDLEGYEVISYNKNFVTIKNSPQTQFHTKQFVNQITKKYDIVDFQISSISIDEVLAKLYKDYEL